MNEYICALHNSDACPGCADEFKTLQEKLRQVEAERDSLKIRYSELEEQTGKTGVKLLRITDEREGLKRQLEDYGRLAIENDSRMRKRCYEAEERLRIAVEVIENIKDATPTTGSINEWCREALSQISSQSTEEKGDGK